MKAARTLVAGTVLLGILTGPVFAQKRPDDPLVIIEKEKKDRVEATDRQYQRTLEQTRKVSDPNRTDPWANMRAPNDGKR